MQNPAVRLLFTQHPSAKTHPIADLRTLDFPGTTLLEPVIRLFHLVALHDVLLEDAKLVADAITVSGISLCGQRIHKTGGQAAQTSVAESHIRFLFHDVFQAVAHLA